jgi:competence protein ComEC
LRSAFDGERAQFFCWAPVCLGAGIAAYFSLPNEPSLAAASALFAIALTAALLSRRGTLASAAMMALTLAATGFALAKLRVQSVAAPVLSKQMRSVDVTGVVLRAERRGKRGQRITLAVEQLGRLPAHERPARVRIRMMTDAVSVAPGDRVRLAANLAPPAKPALPGAFDYARTAWFEQIGGVGYTFSKPEVERGAGAVGWRDSALQRIETARTAIATRVKAALPGEIGAIATALITGERGGISDATNEAFKDSGLFHILSISGLHMVVMAGAVFYSIRLLLAAAPPLALRLPVKKIAAAAGIAAALVYLALSGAAFATVRAATMITIMFAAVLLDRPALAMRNVALAALIILALYPESLFDAGFQMSFAAVTALVAAYEALRQRMRRRDAPHPLARVGGFFGDIVASTLIASVAVAPFAAYHFHQSQQYAVLANLIAIPICNLIVMPMALLALVLMPFGHEGLALWPMGKGIEAMTWCAETVGALPGAVGAIPAIPTLSFGLFAIGGLWIVLWRTRQRLLGLTAIAAGLAIAPTLPRPDILVARDGKLVAMRMPDGRLSALPARQTRFELERWLQHDGDAREAKEAQRGEGFNCDGVSCVADVKGVLLAAPQRPAALIDDCARADLVILSTPAPKGCDKARVLDLFGSWRDLGYAIYIEPGDGAAAMRIETVAERRGNRPWSVTSVERPLPKPRIAPGPAKSPMRDRSSANSDGDAPPIEPRAEIEEDDGEAHQ